MTSRRIEAEIDRLYQLPPGEFTAARNALAKEAGADAPEVRRLSKPPVAAWAVNQLYWRRRPEYDALIAAAKDVRDAHTAILGGRRSDLRAPGKAHDDALDAALKAALSLLQENGQPVTESTRQAILTTLRALPAEDEPGRLTRTLQPGGFEMLAGLSIGRGKVNGARPKPVAAAPSAPVKTPRSESAAKGAHAGSKKATPAEQRAQAQAQARAREAAARAARVLREAEHAARREEFEAARAVREADKAAKALDQSRETVARARQTLEAAEEELEAAEAAARSATRAREAAERRASEATRSLDSARGKAAGES